MKRTIFILSFCMLFVALSAQEFSLNNQNKKMVTLVSSSGRETILEYNFQGFALEDVSTNRGVKKSVKMKNTSSMLEKGNPDLLLCANSLIVPDFGDVEVRVLDIDYVDFQNIEIVPSKGNFARDIDPATVPYEWGSAYNKNDFFPSQVAQVSSPYILRDFRGVSLRVFPLQYNNITKTLRAIKTIKVSVVCNEAKVGENQLVRNRSIQKIDEMYNVVYKRHFFNYNDSKYTPIAERGNYLVICKPEYMNAMKPFVSWKNQIGFPTKIVSSATTGTTSTAIKSYVKNYYDNNELTFLLLVGDAEDLNPIAINNISSNYSDNAFAYISGNDSYPEFYVGRFSANSVADVEVQVKRTIAYEKSPIFATNWLNAVTGIASMENQEATDADYVHIRKLLKKCKDYEYVKDYELYDGSQGGNDAAGNPTPVAVSTAVNNGTGLINYCGHGSDDSFVSSNFSNTDINELNNKNKWPIILSVACVNGNFKGKTCFAEAWLRARKGNDPTGAVATIMSTINQSWVPPMTAQIEMIDVLCEKVSDNTKHSFGGITMSGCMKMNDVHGADGAKMTDTWTIFGDPSLMIRTDTPKIINANIPEFAFTEVPNLNFNCTNDGAFVTMSKNDTIISTTIVTNGMANLTFPAVTSIDTFLITITKYNHVPLIDTLLFVDADGPYLVYENLSINDAAGNNNAQADFNENILLDFTLKNVGIEDANNVVGVISTTNTNVNITDKTESFGNIPIAQTKTINGSYALSIGNNIADQTIVPFQMLATSGIKEWKSMFGITVNAPRLSIELIDIDDQVGGNNNKRLEPGETANVKIKVKNIGHSAHNNTNVEVVTSDNFVVLSEIPSSAGNFQVGETKDVQFTLKANNDVDAGYVATLNFSIGNGFYKITDDIYITVGLLLEDFEKGNLNSFEWQTSGDKPWVVVNQGAYEGTYCLRSGKIDNLQKSVLSLTLNVLKDDSISFYKKVSCEEPEYDYLDFSIDGVSQMKWGNISGWQRVAFPLKSGNRKFSWTYAKDEMMYNGEDAAWIDYIVFPAINKKTAIAEDLNKNSFNVYPNPILNSMSIEINLAASDVVVSELFDNCGRLIKILYSGTMQAGKNIVTFNDLDLIKGNFYVRVSTSRGISTRTIIKM